MRGADTITTQLSFFAPLSAWAQFRIHWLGPVLLASVTAFSCSAARADDSRREIVLRPPFEVRMISRQNWDRSTPETSYLGAHAANEIADARWIVGTFARDERKAIEERVADKQLLDANTRLFRSMVSETITEKILYRGYVILVIEAVRSDGRRFLRNIPMKLVGRDWLMTNDLASDKVFLGLKSGYVDR